MGFIVSLSLFIKILQIRRSIFGRYCGLTGRTVETVTVVALEVIVLMFRVRPAYL